MDAIGVFDSGVGGLTVVKALKEMLPNEHIVYIGDTARVPYGNKSKKSIIDFSILNVMFLLSKGVKFIVVACNTASATALPTLVEKFEVPILGVIEPGAMKAVSHAPDSDIGVIGTFRTIQSEAYIRAIRAIRPDARVHSKACPLFVPLIEENFQTHAAAGLIIEEYLNEVCEHTKTIILGCTHYPLIKQEIQSRYQDVTLIDSAEAVAERVKEMLHEYGTLRQDKNDAMYRYYVSDMSENFLEIARRILDDESIVIKEIDV